MDAANCREQSRSRRRGSRSCNPRRAAASPVRIPDPSLRSPSPRIPPNSTAPRPSVLGLPIPRRATPNPTTPPPDPCVPMAGGAPPATGTKAVETEDGNLPAAEISTENGVHSDASARTSDSDSDPVVEVTGDQHGKGVGADTSNAVKPSDTKPVGLTSSALSIVLAAFALLMPPVLRGFAAVWAKLTPARVAFVLLASLALWLTAGEPQRAVCTFCVIAVSYISLWTIYFTWEIRVVTVLVSVSYIALVANAIANLSVKAGIFVMLLDTAYAAALFGYALADYRQYKGFDKSVESALESARTRSEEDLKSEKGVFAMFSFYSVVVSVLCTVGALWVIYDVVDTHCLVLALSFLIDLSLFLWTCLVGLHLLHCAIVDPHCMTFVYWGAMSLLLPDFFLTYLFGQTIGMLVHPLGVMGIAALLGYNICVYRHMVAL